MQESKESVAVMAMLSFWMGLASIVSIPIYLTINYFFEELSMISSLSGLVFPLAIIGLISGLAFRKKTGESDRSYKFAKAGLIMSALVLSLIVLVFVFIMIAFLPEFFRN